MKKENKNHWSEKVYKPYDEMNIEIPTPTDGDGVYHEKVKDVLENLKTASIDEVLDYVSKKEVSSDSDVENDDFLKKAEELMRSPSSNSLGSSNSKFNRSVHSAGSKNSTGSNQRSYIVRA